MAKVIWVKRSGDKFPMLIGVNAIVRVDPMNQVNEERGAKILLTAGPAVQVEESCAEIAERISRA
jgi:hypothetical protein